MKILLVNTLPAPKIRISVDSYEGDYNFHDTKYLTFTDWDQAIGAIRRLAPQINNTEGTFYSEDPTTRQLIIDAVGYTAGNLIRVMDSVTVHEYDHEKGVHHVFSVSNS